jgi:hypothetical protein
MALSFNEGAALGGSLGDLISSGLDAAGLSAKARARAINDQRFGLSPQAPTGLAGLLQPTQTPVAQNAQGMTGSVAGGQATLSKPTPAPTAGQPAPFQAAFDPANQMKQVDLTQPQPQAAPPSPPSRSSSRRGLLARM